MKRLLLDNHAPAEAEESAAEGAKAAKIKVTRLDNSKQVGNSKKASS